MAMHACMMMQMHMQQTAAAYSKSGIPECQVQSGKPSAATLAAKALGHSEALPTYPTFPMPVSGFCHQTMPVQQPPASCQPQINKAKVSNENASATNLTDHDFAAFIDTFVADEQCAEPCGLTKRASESADVTSGSDASSCDELGLDDLLPLEAVWDAVESISGPASADSLLELVAPRGAAGDAGDPESDLIFGMGADQLDAALIL